MGQKVEGLLTNKLGRGGGLNFVGCFIFCPLIPRPAMLLKVPKLIFDGRPKHFIPTLERLRWRPQPCAAMFRSGAKDSGKWTSSNKVVPGFVATTENRSHVREIPRKLDDVGCASATDWN